jgi:hypothetical protein
MAAAVGLLVSAGAGIFGMIQQNKAMKAQEKAAKEQRSLQMAADARERRRMLREQAIASGQTVNVAAQVGAGQGPTASTALTGGLSGLQNQVLSATAFQGMSAESMKRQQAALNQAAKYQQSASIAAGIGSLGSSIGDFASGLQRTTFRLPSFGQVV